MFLVIFLCVAGNSLSGTSAIRIATLSYLARLLRPLFSPICCNTPQQQSPSGLPDLENEPAFSTMPHPRPEGGMHREGYASSNSTVHANEAEIQGSLHPFRRVTEPPTGFQASTKMEKPQGPNRVKAQDNWIRGEAHFKIEVLGNFRFRRVINGL